jgi:paraquat-inducible protein B
MKNLANSALVGVFTIGGFVILLGFAIFSGGFSQWRESNEKFVLVFNENVFGLHEGGKVTFNGVRIGRVERFFLGDAYELSPVPVLIEINRDLVRRHMILEGSEVFDDEGNFKKEVLPRLIGQLVQESFVTGILYINLNVEKAGAVDDVGENFVHGHRFIRSKASIFAELSESINLEKISKQVSQLIDVATIKLNEFNSKGMSEGLVSLSEETKLFLAGFSDSYLGAGPSITATSEQARETFLNVSQLSARINEMLLPESDLRYGMVTALRDVSAMSKSLKTLADLLERNPQAFLQGKPLPNQND